MSSGADNGLGDRGTIVPASRVRESEIQLTVPARAESLALVRHVLGALAEALGLRGVVVDDIRLAVTEACANVVRHAYDDGDGVIELAVRTDGDSLRIEVADRGRGIAPSPDISGPGLGLPMIAALTEKVEIEHPAGAGSRVAMLFPRRAPVAA